MKFSEIMHEGKTQWLIYQQLDNGKEIFRKRCHCGGIAMYHYEDWEVVKTEEKGNVYGTWKSIKVVLRKGE